MEAERFVVNALDETIPRMIVVIIVLLILPVGGLLWRKIIMSGVVVGEGEKDCEPIKFSSSTFNPRPIMLSQ